MKYTSEMLMKDMKLQVGDRVKYGLLIGVITRNEDNEIIIEVYTQKNEYCGIAPLYDLIDKEITLLPKLKRVGDLKCGEISENKECSKCPLRSICATLSTGRKTTLYEMLEIYKLGKGSYLDQEIHDLLKSRLDKEVVEDND